MMLMMTFILTVTNPHVEMVSLLQTTTWLLRMGLCIRRATKELIDTSETGD
ncbi:hypothetical protein YC2023_020126 [Brassica napus]